MKGGRKGDEDCQFNEMGKITLIGENQTENDMVGQPFE